MQEQREIRITCINLSKRGNIKEYHDYNHSGDDFYYDSNGNMTADLDRDIVTIRYNAIDLPDTVQFKNGSTIIYHI